MNKNHMPPHVGPSVSVIEESEGRNLMSGVDRINTSLEVVKE